MFFLYIYVCLSLNHLKIKINPSNMFDITNNCWCVSAHTTITVWNFSIIDELVIVAIERLSTEFWYEFMCMQLIALLLKWCCANDLEVYNYKDIWHGHFKPSQIDAQLIVRHNTCCEAEEGDSEVGRLIAYWEAAFVKVWSRKGLSQASVAYCITVRSKAQVFIEREADWQNLFTQL